MSSQSYEQPLLSVDVVPVRFDGNQLLVCTGTRIFEPHVGEQALPGVLLLPGEALNQAVYRALADKSAIPSESVVLTRQVGAFDETNRDPRGATISIAFAAVIAGPDGENWRPVAELETLPFDHSSIITAAIARFGELLWRDQAFTRALVGEQFSTGQARTLGELLGATPSDTTNFNRWLKQQDYLQLSDQTVQAGRGRPQRLWTWAGDDGASAQ